LNNATPLNIITRQNPFHIAAPVNVPAVQNPNYIATAAMRRHNTMIGNYPRNNAAQVPAHVPHQSSRSDLQPAPGFEQQHSLPPMGSHVKPSPAIQQQPEHMASQSALGIQQQPSQPAPTVTDFQSASPRSQLAPMATATQPQIHHSAPIFQTPHVIQQRSQLQHSAPIFFNFQSSLASQQLRQPHCSAPMRSDLQPHHQPWNCIDLTASV
jgi:hypothetical protein